VGSKVSANAGSVGAEGPGDSVTLRFWAAAREAAGWAEESGPAADLSAVLADSVARRGQSGSALASVFARCSFLVNGAPVGTRDPRTICVAPGSIVDVLPPFAGG
jgi:molybdopterin synthase sulfur carrier subunit